MVKRQPTHPGIILEKDYIQPLHINLQDLADKLGVSRKTLQKIRAGRGRITTKMALRLSRLFNTSPELWLNLQQKYDIWEAWKLYPEIAKLKKVV